MIGILIIIAVLMLCIRIRPAASGEDYMAPAVTRTVNGVFIVCVFFRHIFQYRAFEGEGWRILHLVDHGLGQFLVVTFLFFSGYGIMESYRKRGIDYIRQIPRRRILVTWIRFVCCVAVYLAAVVYLGVSYSSVEILGGFLGWCSLGNSNWYIFVILGLYLLTWAAFLLAERLPKFGGEAAGIGILIVLTFCFAVLLSVFQEEYWYNTIYCYAAGMAFSYLRPSWDHFFSGTAWRHGGFLVICLLLWGICFRLRAWLVIYQLAAVLFGIMICWLLGRVTVKSRILEWMGGHLFGIYMMQRIPMLLLEQAGISDLAYLLICAVCTILLGWMMDRLTRLAAERLSGG